MAEAAQHITGHVVYHGETWVSPAYRGNGTGGMLCRLGLMLTHIRFDPDYIYGFLVKQNALSNFGLRAGFPHVEADALNWVRAPRDYKNEWLVWGSRSDLANLATKPDDAFT